MPTYTPLITHLTLPSIIDTKTSVCLLMCPYPFAVYPFTKVHISNLPDSPPNLPYKSFPDCSTTTKFLTHATTVYLPQIRIWHMLSSSSFTRFIALIHPSWFNITKMFCFSLAHSQILCHPSRSPPPLHPWLIRQGLNQLVLLLPCGCDKSHMPNHVSSWYFVKHPEIYIRWIRKSWTHVSSQFDGAL